MFLSRLNNKLTYSCENFRAVMNHGKFPNVMLFFFVFKCNLEIKLPDCKLIAVSRLAFNCKYLILQEERWEFLHIYKQICRRGNWKGW